MTNVQIITPPFSFEPAKRKRAFDGQASFAVMRKWIRYAIAGLLLLALVLVDKTPEQLRAQERTDELILEIVNVHVIEPQVHGAADGQICGLVGQPLLLEVDVVNRAKFAVKPEHVRIEGEGFRHWDVRKRQEFYETIPSFLEPARIRREAGSVNNIPFFHERIDYFCGERAPREDDWPPELLPGTRLTFPIAVQLPADEGNHKAILSVHHKGGRSGKVSRELVVKTVTTAIMPAKSLRESSFRLRKTIVEPMLVPEPLTGALKSEIAARDSSVLGYSVFMGTDDTHEAALAIHTYEEDGIMIDDVKVEGLPGGKITYEIVSGLVPARRAKEEKEKDTRVVKIGEMLTFDLPQEWVAQGHCRDIVIRLETKGAARGIYELPVVLKYRKAMSGTACESRSSIHVGVYDVRRMESKSAEGMRWEMTTPEGARIALETTKKPETVDLSLPGILRQEKAMETAKQLVLDAMRKTQIQVQWENEELAESKGFLAERKRTALISLGLRQLGKHLCGAMVDDAACIEAHKANMNPYAAILAGGAVAELAQLYAEIWFAQTSKESTTRLLPRTFAGEPIPLPVPVKPLQCNFYAVGSMDVTLRNARNALENPAKLDLYAISGETKKKKLLSLTPTQLKSGDLVFELDLDDLRKGNNLQHEELNAGILLWEEKGGVYACDVHTLEKTARFWLHGVASGRYLVGTAISRPGKIEPETRLGSTAYIEVLVAEEKKAAMPGPESLWLGEDEFRLMNRNTFFQKVTTRISREGGKVRHEQIQTGKFYEKDELALDFSIMAVSIDKERNTTKISIAVTPLRAEDKDASVTVRTLLHGEKVGDYVAGTISLGEPTTLETEVSGILGVEFDALQMSVAGSPASVLTWIGGVVAKEGVKVVLRQLVKALLSLRFGPDATLEIWIANDLSIGMDIGQIICPIWRFKMTVSGYDEKVYRPGPGQTKIEFSVAGGSKETNLSSKDHEVYYETYHALSALDGCASKPIEVWAELTGYLALYEYERKCRYAPNNPDGCTGCWEPEPGHFDYIPKLKEWVKVGTISERFGALVRCCFGDRFVELDSAEAEHPWSSSGTVECHFQQLSHGRSLLPTLKVKLEKLRIEADGHTTLSPSSWQGIVIQQNSGWEEQFAASHDFGEHEEKHVHTIQMVPPVNAEGKQDFSFRPGENITYSWTHRCTNFLGKKDYICKGKTKEPPTDVPIEKDKGGGGGGGGKIEPPEGEKDKDGQKEAIRRVEFPLPPCLARIIYEHVPQASSLQSPASTASKMLAVHTRQSVATCRRFVNNAG